MVAPVTAQPDKLAHYPVTCTGVAKTPFWQQPPNMTTSTSSSGGAGTSGNGPGGSGTASTTSSSSVAWVYTSWDESKDRPEATLFCRLQKIQMNCHVKGCCIGRVPSQECEQICGLKEIRETRSVTCQAPQPSPTGQLDAEAFSFPHFDSLFLQP